MQLQFWCQGDGYVKGKLYTIPDHLCAVIDVLLVLYGAPGNIYEKAFLSSRVMNPCLW